MKISNLLYVAKMSVKERTVSSEKQCFLLYIKYVNFSINTVKMTFKLLELTL